MWAMTQVTAAVSRANQRNYITREMCTEIVLRAEDLMVVYSTTQLGIRSAVHGNGFYVIRG